jgi:serine/threonine protein kinase
LGGNPTRNVTECDVHGVESNNKIKRKVENVELYNVQISDKNDYKNSRNRYQELRLQDIDELLKITLRNYESFKEFKLEQPAPTSRTTHDKDITEYALNKLNELFHTFNTICPKRMFKLYKLHYTEELKYIVCGEIGSGGQGFVKLSSTKLDGFPQVSLSAIKYFNCRDSWRNERDAYKKIERMLPNLIGLHIPKLISARKKSKKRGRERFLEFQYIDGTPLSKLKVVCLNNLELRRSIIKQLVSIVRQLHNVGLAHGDIKPANIVIVFQKGDDGRYKLDTTARLVLIDFGLAYYAEDKKLCTMVGGTQMFMSPEVFLQVKSLHVEPFDAYLNDVWAIGVVCYVLGNGSLAYLEPTSACPMYQKFITSGMYVKNDLKSSVIVKALCQIEPEKRESLKVIEGYMAFPKDCTLAEYKLECAAKAIVLQCFYRCWKARKEVAQIRKRKRVVILLRSARDNPSCVHVVCEKLKALKISLVELFSGEDVDLNGIALSLNFFDWYTIRDNLIRRGSDRWTDSLRCDEKIDNQTFEDYENVSVVLLQLFADAIDTAHESEMDITIENGKTLAVSLAKSLMGAWCVYEEPYDVGTMYYFNYILEVIVENFVSDFELKVFLSDIISQLLKTETAYSNLAGIHLFDNKDVLKEVALHIQESNNNADITRNFISFLKGSDHEKLICLGIPYAPMVFYWETFCIPEDVWRGYVLPYLSNYFSPASNIQKCKCCNLLFNKSMFLIVEDRCPICYTGRFVKRQCIFDDCRQDLLESPQDLLESPDFIDIHRCGNLYSNVWFDTSLHNTHRSFFRIRGSPQMLIHITEEELCKYCIRNEGRFLVNMKLWGDSKTLVCKEGCNYAYVCKFTSDDEVCILNGKIAHPGKRLQHGDEIDFIQKIQVATLHDQEQIEDDDDDVDVVDDKDDDEKDHHDQKVDRI